jgi:hypothetical protein
MTIQDAANSMLVRNWRQQLHARIAATMEDQFPEIVNAQPECWRGIVRKQAHSRRRSATGLRRVNRLSHDGR